MNRAINGMQKVRKNQTNTKALCHVFPWVRPLLGMKKTFKEPSQPGSEADKTISHPFTDFNPGYNPDIHPFIFIWWNRETDAPEPRANTKPIIFKSSELFSTCRFLCACDRRTMTCDLWPFYATYQSQRCVFNLTTHRFYVSLVVKFVFMARLTQIIIDC